MNLIKLLEPLGILSKAEGLVSEYKNSPIKYDEIEIADIAYDSRNVKKGSLFVCIRGAASDGHKYVESAIANGAAFIVAEEEISSTVPYLVLSEKTTVQDTRQALALMSAVFFGNPADNDIKVIGITGTKGKTTAAHMICSILESAGHKTGIIGTIGVEVGDEIIKLDNTTPISYEVQRYLRYMADNGCEYCVMEVSSIGLRDFRVFGFEFEIGMFTNFSDDHIGGVEHKDMQEYMESKSMLFRMCKVGVINIDDKSYKGIINNHTCAIRTYGFDESADIVGSDYHLLMDAGTLGITLKVSGDLDFIAEVGIPGKFNAYNALSAIAVTHELGINEADMNEGLRNAKVKGRVEPIKMPRDFTLLIDYAHNAVSMENLLETLREYSPNRLICMFGAGGNRPKVRRYEMGEASGKLADLSVITEDNSRFEDVMDIIEDIKIGMAKTDGEFVVIPNRIDAIRYCIENAQDGDIVVLAGKGHEDYQETNGVKAHLDEREVIRDILSDLS